MLELMYDMVKNIFFEPGDFYLMKAWIEDLYSIGYQFPSLVPHKRFAYLIQTESELPSQLKNIQFFNVDVFLLSWKSPPNQLDKNEVKFSIFDPNTTWSSGRNLLLQFLKEQEQQEGKYDYLIFLDDDVRLEIEKKPQLDPFRTFEKWLLEWEPAVGVPTQSPYMSSTNWDLKGVFPMYHFDAVKIKNNFKYFFLFLKRNFYFIKGFQCFS